MAGMEFKSSEFAKQPPLFWKLKWAAGQGMWRMHPHDRTVDPARLSQADTDDIGEEAKKGASYIYIYRFDKQRKQGSDDLTHISVVGGPSDPKCIYNLLMSQQCMLSLLFLLVCDSRVLALRLTDPGSPWHDDRGGLSCL